MDEKFRNAEDEYFVLRGKLDTGRIGKNLFELALRDLMVQDAQGRWWMLGPDTGNWYMHDGKTWIEANPAKVEVAQRVTTSQPKSSPGGSASDPKSGSNRLPLIAGIGCVALICIGIAIASGYGLTNLPLRSGNTGQVAFGTPVIPITTPTFAGSSSAATVTATTSLAPIDSPSPTLLRVVRPSSTPTLAFAPGVYVTGLRIDPPQPKRKFDITFYPTFLNNTGIVQNFKLVAYVYFPEQTHSMGETAPNVVTIPPGSFEFPLVGWMLTGPGGCQDFIVRVSWWDDLKIPTFFNIPNGHQFQIPMTVCP